MGRELRHGPWGRDWKVRVFSRERRYADQRVHENLEALDEVGTLDGALLHHPYRDLSHQVLKIATVRTVGGAGPPGARPPSALLGPDHPARLAVHPRLPDHERLARRGGGFRRVDGERVLGVPQVRLPLLMEGPPAV